MLALLAFITAGALSLPVPDSAVVRRIGEGDNRSVIADVFISPEGTVLSCGIVFPLERTDRLKRNCERAIGMDAGSTATGPDGQPAGGPAIIARVSGFSSLPAPERPVVLEVSASGISEPVIASVLVFIDESGRPTHCQAGASIAESLSKLACQGIDALSFPTRQGGDGTNIAYVWPVNVGFVPAAN